MRCYATQLRVVLLGLERSGKSSWVRALRPAAARGPAPPPTTQARVERVVVRTQSSGAFTLRCTDLPGGAEAAADEWPRHFAGAHAVVFVLDAADALRVQEAQDALDRRVPQHSRCSACNSFRQRLTTHAARCRRALAHPQLAGLPLLLLANKCDVAGAMSAHQADEALEPGACSGESREWAVLACSAATGQGLQSGVDWLVEAAIRAMAKRGAKDPGAASEAPALPPKPLPALPPDADEPRSSAGGDA